MQVRSIQTVNNSRKHPGDEGAADDDGVEDVPAVPAVAARMQHHSQVQDLVT